MKVLALVDSPDHVCCRYRLRAFEPALTRAGGSLEFVGLARGAIAEARQCALASGYDTVVLQRRLLPVWHLRWLRKRARRLIFDFDDAVMYRDSYDPRGAISRRRSRRFTATVRAADVVIAGNDFLADCALRAGARPERLRVIPTCVSTERYALSTGSGRTDALELVWIGSSSTLRGIERQRALWDRLAREVPGVRMRVICDRFPDLGAMPVVGVPWSATSEAADLAAGDVGISWVPDDLWSRGKCGLKVLQYQAAGLPVLANPVGVHDEMIEPGVTGWLPSTVGEWADAVRTLMAGPALRTQIGRAARQSVEANYSVAAWEATFVATVAGVPVEPGPAAPSGPPARVPSPRARVGASTAEARR